MLLLLLLLVLGAGGAQNTVLSLECQADTVVKEGETQVISTRNTEQITVPCLVRDGFDGVRLDVQERDEHHLNAWFLGEECFPSNSLWFTFTVRTQIGSKTLEL